MSFNIICAIIALGLEVIDVISFLIRLKKKGSISKESFDRSFIVKLIIIYISVLVIPLICFFMDFGRTGNIVLCGCAVLGLELANKDLLAAGNTEEE